MARIRSIKPDFFLSENLSELSVNARLFFIGLWTQADREGRLEDRPKRLKVQIFPYDPIEVDPLLKELAKRKDDQCRPEYIDRYKVQGVALIQIVNFLKHQRPNTREADSILPKNPAKHDLDDAFHAQDQGEGKGREGKGKGSKDSGSSLKGVNGAQVHKSVDNSALLEIRMPWGKEYKDVYIANLPFDYCEWCLSSANKKRGTIGPELRKALQARIDQKLGEMTGAQRKAHGRA